MSWWCVTHIASRGYGANMNRPSSSRAFLAFDFALSTAFVIAPLVVPRSKRRYVALLAALAS